MSWFKKIKQSIQNITIGAPAGEWAATAMACMVFVDGEAEASEIEAAKAVVASNPVIADSIGSKKGLALFEEAVRAIGTAPAAMLGSYMTRLQAQAAKVDKQEDRNFAMATVIAIATADGEIEPAEHAMLLRLKEIIGADVDIPPMA